MAAFDLNARIHLSGPDNLPIVVRNIRAALGGIKANLDVGISSGATAKINELNKSLLSVKKTISEINSSALSVKQATQSVEKYNAALAKTGTITKTNTAVTTKNSAAMRDVASGAKEASKGMEEFGRISGLAIRRYAGFAISTGVIFGLVRATTEAVGAAIKFERELIKVSQVTGTSVANLSALTDEIDRLSVSLGVSSSDLIGVSRTLSQAGLSARDTRIALEALAESSLAPTFTSIQNTTEGAIAAMNQFGLQASDLAGVLGSINAVAGQFAVESDDIIGSIRRGGSVFAAASAGIRDNTGALVSGQEQLRQYIALFTSVRATTRESADSISTGLRTIFSRIQRGTTIDSLRELGIELLDVEGKFVGTFDAIKLISEGLDELSTRDPKFIAIAQELGGVRQLRTLIPLIEQSKTRNDALKVAQEGVNSVTEDAEAAQKALAVQITKVREDFLLLGRNILKDDTFRFMAEGAISLASGLVGVADAVRPVLPLLLAFGAAKLALKTPELLSGFRVGVLNKERLPEVSTARQEASNQQLVEARTANSTFLKTNSAATQNNTKSMASLSTELSKSPITAAIKLNTGALSTLNNSITGLTTAVSRIPLASAPTGPRRRNAGGRIQKFAKGGGVKSLLTPGELVFGPDVVDQVGLKSLRQFNERGDASGLGPFNRGGVSMVPGSGDGDTFPATLPEGSFVIRKDSVEKGAIRRDFDDAKRFANGGDVQVKTFAVGGVVQEFGGGGSARKKLSSGTTQKLGGGGRTRRRLGLGGAAQKLGRGGGARRRFADGDFVTPSQAKILKDLISTAEAKADPTRREVQSPIGTRTPRPAGPIIIEGVTSPSRGTQSSPLKGVGAGSFGPQVKTFVDQLKQNGATSKEVVAGTKSLVRSLNAGKTVEEANTKALQAANRQAIVEDPVSPGTGRLLGEQTEDIARRGRERATREARVEPGRTATILEQARAADRGTRQATPFDRSKLEGRLTKLGLSTAKVSLSMAQYDTAIKNNHSVQDAQRRAMDQARESTRSFAARLKASRVGQFVGRAGGGVTPGRVALGPGGPVPKAKGGLGQSISKRLGGNAGFALAGGALLLSNQLQQSENTTTAAAGGVIGGAASGAVLGQFVGPLGIAVGTVAGGLLGLTSALDGAAAKIRAVEIASAIKDFQSAIDKFSSDVSDVNLSKLFEKLGASSIAVQKQVDADALGSTTSRIFEALGQIFIRDPSRTESVANIEEGITTTLSGPDFFRALEPSFAVADIFSAFTDLAGITSQADAARRGAANIETLTNKDVSAIVKAATPEADRILKSIDLVIGRGREPEPLSAENIEILGQTDVEAVRKRNRGDDAAVIKAGIRIAAERKEAARDLKKLSDATSKFNIELKLLSSRFSALSDITRNAANIGSAFDNAISGIEASIQGRLSNIKIDDPFANIRGASREQVDVGLETFRRTFGDTPATREQAEAVVASKTLQDFLPGILEQAASGISPEEIQEKFQAGITDLNTDDVSSKFKQGIQDIFEGAAKGLSPEELTAKIKDPGFADKLIGPDLLKAPQELAKAFQSITKITNDFVTNSNKYISAQQDAANKQVEINSLIIQRRNQFKELSGKELTVEEQFAPVRSRVLDLSGRGGGATLDPNVIQNRLETLLIERVGLEGQRTQILPGPGQEEAFKSLEGKIAENSNATLANNQALGILASDTTKLSSIQKKISAFQGRRDAAKTLVERIIQAGFDPKERIKLAREGAFAQSLLQDKGVPRGLQAKDLPGVRQILQALAKGQKTPEQRAEAQKDILDVEKKLASQLGPLGPRLAAFVAPAFAPPGQAPEEIKLRGDLEQANQDQINAMKAQTEASNVVAENLKGLAFDKLTNSLNDLKASVDRLAANRTPANPADEANPAGGSRRSGGLIPGSFNGLDSVRTNLQAGEFVVKRGVAQKNKDALRTLNNTGSVQGFAHGGLVFAQDKDEEFFKSIRTEPGRSEYDQFLDDQFKKYGGPPSPSEYDQFLDDTYEKYDLQARSRPKSEFDKFLDSAFERYASPLTRRKSVDPIDLLRQAERESNTFTDVESALAFLKKRGVVPPTLRPNQPVQETIAPKTLDALGIGSLQGASATARDGIRGGFQSLGLTGSQLLDTGKSVISRASNFLLDEESGLFRRANQGIQGGQERAFTKPGVAEKFIRKELPGFLRANFLNDRFDKDRLIQANQNPFDAGSVLDNARIALKDQRGARFVQKLVKDTFNTHPSKTGVDMRNLLISNLAEIENEAVGEDSAGDVDRVVRSSSGPFSQSVQDQTIARATAVDGFGRMLKAEDPDAPTISDGVISAIKREFPVISIPAPSFTRPAPRDDSELSIRQKTLQARRAERAQSRTQRVVSFLSRSRRGQEVLKNAQNLSEVEGGSPISTINKRLSTLGQLPNTPDVKTLRSAFRRAKSKARDITDETGVTQENFNLSSFSRQIDEAFLGQEFEHVFVGNNAQPATRRSRGDKSQELFGAISRLRDAGILGQKTAADLLRTPETADVLDPIAFATGGPVGKDTVPAMLQPGEFVLKKSVVDGNLRAIQNFNDGKVPRFQNGGLVGATPTQGIAQNLPGTIGFDTNTTIALNNFNTTVAQFGIAISGLSEIAIASNQIAQASQQFANLNIPETISVEVAPVQVIVTLNGAEALASIEGSMGDLVSKKIGAALNRHINVITGETNEVFHG